MRLIDRIKKEKPPLGSGERFHALEQKVGSPALAAWIGRKKWGKKRFSRLGAKGKRDAAK